MPQYIAPGAFVEEVPPHAPAIQGVETATTGFVGACRYGPVDGVPVLLTSLAGFERLYGDGRPLAFDADDAAGGTNFLWHAVRSFFEQGGRRLHVARVYQAPSGGGDGRARGLAGGLRLAARHPGAMGQLRVTLTLALGAPLQDWNSAVDGDVMWAASGAARAVQGPDDLPLALARLGADGCWEVGGDRARPSAVRPLTLRLELHAAAGHPLAIWPDLSPNPARGAASLSEGFGPAADAALPVVVEGPAWKDGLALVHALTQGWDFKPTPQEQAEARQDGCEAWRRRLEAGVVVTAQLSGGGDGQRPGVLAHVGQPEPPAGLQALAAVEEVAIVAAPGAGWRAVDAHAVAAALVAHAEQSPGCIAVLDAPAGADPEAVQEFRRGLGHSHAAALYYPWVSVPDPHAAVAVNLPPSAVVAGIYARVDAERGVFKAPTNEVLRGVVSLERDLGSADRERLNREGINCLLPLVGRGLRLWGARTLSTDPEWMYVNQRRYLFYLQRSIGRGTAWVAFEPQGEAAWARLRRAVEDFLQLEWRRGALQGSRPDQAFFVRCDLTTMTQADLDAGRVVMLVGVALLKPAEFVIFRIGQWTADARS
jgi:uncharacterized protein